MRKQKNLRGLFGAELVRQRKAAGLSAAELAACVGVSVNTVYRWENKISLPAPRAWSALVKWAKENDIDVDRLSFAYTHCVAEPLGD